MNTFSFRVQDVLVPLYQIRAENCSGILQISKENVLKDVIVFQYTYPERDGNVSTYSMEDVYI